MVKKIEKWQNPVPISYDYRNIFWNADWSAWGSLMHEMLQNIEDFKRAEASFFIKAQQKQIFTVLFMGLSYPKINGTILFS